MLVETLKIIISIGIGFMLGMIVTTIYVARK